MPSRLVRKLAVWIALLAVLAVTFVPTLTQLRSSMTAGLDVCSADVSRRAPAGGEHHPLDLCPSCALHADLALPPLPGASLAAAGVRFVELPPAFLQAPRATGVWSTSQPRAPPVLA